MAVDAQAAAELLTALVAIPSINPAFAAPQHPAAWFGEERLARFVADWLEDAGLSATLDHVEVGRPNVVARLASASGAPRMIWEAHLDTVQVDGMATPFAPSRRGNRLYGRGAVDDKASLAMFMLAARALAAAPPHCDLTLLAAVDEEVAFQGVLHHLRRHPPYDLGIAGEPTGLSIVTACKGCVRWHIDVFGRAAHASSPQGGIDALRLARALLARLDAHMADRHDHHPALGGRTLTCTRLEAGEGPNTVPSHARMTFDFRILPAQSGDEAWQEIAAVVAAFAAELDPAARVEMQPPFIDSASMEVPHDAKVVTALAAAAATAGLTAEIGAVPYGSDASKMTRAGTPTVIFGPGSIAQAHAVDEYVDIDEIVTGANVLVTLACSL